VNGERTRFRSNRCLFQHSPIRPFAHSPIRQFAHSRQYVRNFSSAQQSASMFSAEVGG